MVKYIQNENCPYRLVDGYVFILEPSDSNFIKLNKAGSHIWTSISHAKTINEILKDLQDIYEINEQNKEKILNEINNFLKNLEAKKLIISIVE